MGAAVEEEEEKTDEQKESKLKKAQSRVFHGTAFAVVAATAAFGAVLGKVRKQKKADAESEAAAKPEEEEKAAAPEAEEETTAAPETDAEQKESAEPRPSEPSMEDIKIVADDISNSMQNATEEHTDKEEAHKVLNPLHAKLAIVKAKFADIAAKRSNKKNKKEETT